MVPVEGKKSMQKKRHTKPCKYFQVNRCPLPAEVCDFAHVMAVPAVSQSRPPCRYYLAGSCNNGLSCRYRHGEEATTSQESKASMFVAYNPYYPPWTSYSSRSGMYPNQLLIPSMMPSHFHSRESVSSGSSSLSPSDFDEGYITTEDPQYAEHSHQHQSQIRVYEEQQSMPIVFPSLESIPLKVGTLQSPVSPNSAPGLSPKKSSRATGKNKAIRYKTKPCKFYNTLKGCPTGEGCTFIHGESDRALLNISLSSGRGGSRLSLKAASPGEEAARKNFFPIPWRVIGGGVLLSSKQSRRNSRSRDREPGQGGLTEEGVNTVTATLKQQAVPRVISPENGQRNEPRRRVRSNSNPPTPSSAHVKVNTLFSAESPGVL